MVIRLIVCGRPPGSAGLAPHACLHNITPDVIGDDCNAMAGIERAGGWPADGLGCAGGEQPATTDASPAPPAIARRRRRVTPLAPATEGLSGFATVVHPRGHRAEAQTMAVTPGAAGATLSTW